jgi:hypothetical protein
MQAKSFCLVHKALLENLILFQKPISYCPTLILWILENFTKLFESVWSQIAKVMKAIRKQKKKRRKRKKNIKWTQGNVSAQLQIRPVAHLSNSRTGTQLPLPSSLTGGTPSPGSSLTSLPLSGNGNRRRPLPPLKSSLLPAHFQL